jgi:gas vesicle protein
MHSGRFILGMATGIMAGAAIGITMAPSHRQLKRAAHIAAKRVNDAVENLADAIDL